MATNTTNYALVKPDLADSADIMVINGNMDTIDTQLKALDTNKANLAGPALTGTPTAPTAAVGTSTLQIATTAFVNSEIANDRPFEATATNIKVNGTQSVGTLNTVARGDHVHPTDTSRAAASHTQSANTISAGTLAGIVNANVSSMSSVASAQVRDISAGTTDLTAGSSALTTGTIYVCYV